MNGCGEYSGHIQLYLDKELSGPALKEFCSHLKICHACTNELQIEEKLSCLIRQSWPLYFASDDLRARIMQATAESLSSAKQSEPDDCS
jgi:anti-sigma factor (TIGR02949 family)